MGEIAGSRPYKMRNISFFAQPKVYRLSTSRKTFLHNT